MHVIEQATSLEHALSQLGDLGKKVCGRLGVNKRSNEDEELWCLRHLINVLANHSKILWPLSVYQPGKTAEGMPDFIMIENGSKYGLEITRAVSGEDERELTEAERANAGVYFIGDYGGRKSTDVLSAAAEIAYNIQEAIERKRHKPYVLQRPTDLFIYIKGNNVIWLDNNDATEDGQKYHNIVCNFEYPNMDNFRNVMLYWDSGRLYFIKESKNDPNFTK
ncbi:MAG: hypothetical protein COB92_06595 [Robiginitomaculum sp.]|nr:MAG: hypothetical protein COB92_06595 [Robiginitomaculum sp.]